MPTKSFKIGEYAIGGIIKVQINGKAIQVQALDYNSKKEVMSGSCMSDEYDARWKMLNFLNELTSSYYADKVLEWIESNVELHKGSGWIWSK
jgi:hypothetical protein